MVHRKHYIGSKTGDSYCWLLLKKGNELVAGNV